MPTVAIRVHELHERLGREYTVEEFEDLCFEFGIELDEVTTERTMEAAEKGQTGLEVRDDDVVVYKIDVAANRYDLLCIEGLVRALKIFLGDAELPNYRVSDIAPEDMQVMTVAPETADVRPFVVSAVLRNVTFTPENYKSFIELQDKLHHNICRRRTLVAIGTHDLDTIEGPFSYEALPPEEINFVPLEKDQSYSAVELMELYESHAQLKKFLHIIRDEPRYPVIYDAQRRVLSMPPIINSDHSKIRLETRNVFIESTATDLTKAKVVLCVLTCMFSEYCDEPFVIEPVKVVNADGSEAIYPDLSSWDCTAEIADINRQIGINISAEEIANLANKMGLPSTVSGEQLVVSVPPTRADILHACDLVEDIAVGYGFNNVEKTIPQCLTVGKQLPINKLADLLRLEIASTGFYEVLTLALCATEENYDFLRRPNDGLACKLSNPKTIEFQVVRTSLAAGILKTVACNKVERKPIRVFEVADVVFQDGNTRTGARNERHVAALYCNTTTAGFETIHGLLDRIMAVLNVQLVSGDPAKRGELPTVDGKPARYYHLAVSEEPMFLDARRVDLFYRDMPVGHFGIVHPEVLTAFNLRDCPCSFLEFNLEPFLAD